MAFLQASSLLSGQEGRAYCQIDGKNEELMYLKNIEAVVKKKKTPVRTLGRRGEQYRAAGFSGEGKMTVYYVTSFFREMMIGYMKNGRDVYFDLLIVNEDPQSSFGSQSVLLKNCNLDRILLTKLDVSEDMLDEEMSFTFEDAELLESFSDRKN